MKKWILKKEAQKFPFEKVEDNLLDRVFKMLYSKFALKLKSS